MIANQHNPTSERQVDLLSWREYRALLDSLIDEGLLIVNSDGLLVVTALGEHYISSIIENTSADPKVGS